MNYRPDVRRKARGHRFIFAVYVENHLRHIHDNVLTIATGPKNPDEPGLLEQARADRNIEPLREVIDPDVLRVRKAHSLRH